MMEPLEPMFSVVIPTFNRARYLPLAVDSVLRQQFGDFEIIVVDDGSTDETSKVAATYGDRIKYLRQENRGVSAARNAGVAASHGRWVAYLDSDDEWLEGYLQRQQELISRHPSAVGVILNSAAQAIDGKETITFEERALPGGPGKWTEWFVERAFGVIIKHHIATLQPCVIRRETLLKTRLFDESLTIAEDLDVIAQAALMGPFVFCNQIGARIIRRKETLTNLSEQFVRSGIRTRLSWERVYERFLQNESLSGTELATLRSKFASNQRALGNLYLRAGSAVESRRSYKAAWELDRSLASAVRLLLSLLPFRLGRFLLHKEGALEPGTPIATG